MIAANKPSNRRSNRPWIAHIFISWIHADKLEKFNLNPNIG